MGKIEAPLDNLVYAISIHNGLGGMAAGFQSEGAMGFWTDPADADNAAKALAEQLSNATPGFDQYGDVVVIAIHQNMTTIHQLFDSVIEKFSE